ncbi:hypothetical protein KAU11_01790 [Candidatus Babeliales bacterium]|nr:hypothetical protein [Candidatus Babeliales bacterium]
MAGLFRVIPLQDLLLTNNFYTSVCRHLYKAWIQLNVIKILFFFLCYISTTKSLFAFNVRAEASFRSDVFTFLAAPDVAETKAFNTYFHVLDYISENKQIGETRILNRALKILFLPTTNLSRAALKAIILSLATAALNENQEPETAAYKIIQDLPNYGTRIDRLISMLNQKPKKKPFINKKKLLMLLLALIPSFVLGKIILKRMAMQSEKQKTTSHATKNELGQIQKKLQALKANMSEYERILQSQTAGTGKLSEELQTNFTKLQKTHKQTFAALSSEISKLQNNLEKNPLRKINDKIQEIEDRIVADTQITDSFIKELKTRIDTLETSKNPNTQSSSKTTRSHEQDSNESDNEQDLSEEDFEDNEEGNYEEEHAQFSNETYEDETAGDDTFSSYY